MLRYKPHARVASSTFRRIDGVDGVLTTHKRHGWQHAWTVTDGSDAAAPRPFAAKATVPASVAVPVMCVLVLTCAAAALLVVLDGRPDRPQLMTAAVGVLLVWTGLLLAPAWWRFATRPNRSSTRRSHDNGQRTEVGTCSTDQGSSTTGGVAR